MNILGLISQLIGIKTLRLTLTIQVIKVFYIHSRSCGDYKFPCSLDSQTMFIIGPPRPTDSKAFPSLNAHQQAFSVINMHQQVSSALLAPQYMNSTITVPRQTSSTLIAFPKTMCNHNETHSHMIDYP